jgi:hypothetical protein
MSWTCQACGRDNTEASKICICGDHAEKSILKESAGTGIEKLKEQMKKELFKSQTEELIIKERDSWVFTFSQADKSICLGTPALQSFRLKLTKNDLEELLELLYQKTGEEKTTRKLSLSIEELPDFICQVGKMIEDKKSQVTLKFEREELQEISNLINIKLKT